MDEVSYNFFLAKKNFLTDEQCQLLREFLENPSSKCESVDLVVQEIVNWNSKTLNFDIDETKPIITNFTGYEATAKTSTVPDHAIHIGNIRNPSPMKWTAIVNLHNRDDVQGAELIFRTWATTPYKDNFGHWKGDPTKPHQPQWINEQGSIIIYPSMVENGFALVTSGTAYRAKISLTGPQFR